MLKRYRRKLMDLYGRIRELEADRVGKRVLALEIQEELLRCIVQAEARIRRRRVSNAQTKRDMSKCGNSREISSNLRDLHERGLAYIQGQKKLIGCLRSIGDALAFIYGDRYELKQLMSNNDSGFISGKRGTRLERAALRACFQWGATAVMNDLTNTLRQGDITLFRPDHWPDGGSPVFLIELKSGRGGNKKRAARQQQALADTMKYIQTDLRQTENGVRMRAPLTEEVRRHDEAITRLAKDLPRRGWVTTQVEDSLYYIIIDCDLPEDGVSEAFYFLRGREHHHWHFIYVNKLRDMVLGYYPLPLLIHDPETLYRFYNGEFVIYIAVNVTSLNEEVASRGIFVKSEPDGSWKLGGLKPDDNWDERYILSRTVGLLGAEFASLRWFIDNIISGPMNIQMDKFILEQQPRRQ